MTLTDMNILHVVGARPNFMKIAPIMAAMAQQPAIRKQILVHTGQHYDENMSRVFFEDLQLPQPDVYLGVGSGSHAQQTARVMMAFEPVLLEHNPDWVVVVGDVNSTLACALVAAKLGIRVAHVEAGLRSFDWTMPEEINRVLTDRLSDMLFTTEPSGTENLRREGIPKEKIHFVGNVMIDTLVRLLPVAKERWPHLQAALGLERYVLVTLHRPANVDDRCQLREILDGLGDIAGHIPVIFPLHPRTRERMHAWQYVSTPSGLLLLEPLGYLDFLALMQRAEMIITDSGGIQEEATYLQVPCLTVRPNTERPITLEMGTNRLVEGERGALVAAARSVLEGHGRGQAQLPVYWEGQAAPRIVSALVGGTDAPPVEAVSR